MNDKDIELLRYNARAAHALEADNAAVADMPPPYVRIGEDHYRKLLSEAPPRCEVLEIGAGMGEHTECLLKNEFIVCATDISPESVKLLQKRFGESERFSAQVADMEALPFTDASFDIICCAGALSYGDNEIVQNEIYRVLRRGGMFIALDTLNHNPIYKLNRFLHYLRGHRTRSTLQRMPTERLIESYSLKFGVSEVKYFGSAIWLSVFLKLIFSAEQVSVILDSFDKFIGVRKSAFKFTIKAIKS